MSTASMILYNNRNGIKSAKSMLSEPITLVLDHIDAIDTMCGQIRANRNLGPVTMALDELESSLEDSRRRILSNIKVLHANYGDLLDKHNDPAIKNLLDCSKSIQLLLIPKLHKVALRQNTQFGSRMEDPHFDDILDEFKEIDNSVYDSLRTINRRMGGSDSDLRSPTKSSGSLRGSSKSEKKLGQGEVSIDSKLFDELLQIAENSWCEKVMQGRLVWINVVDNEKIRMQRPENGYIKELDKSSERPNALAPFPQLGLLGRGNENGGGLANQMARLRLQEQEANNGLSPRLHGQGILFQNLRNSGFRY